MLGRLLRSEILETAGWVVEIKQLGIAGEEDESMCGGGRGREAVRECERRAGL
ncbi:MAG: hypothetical protein QOF83_3388 [Solirubrobacteraceae bacterium]|nr:hypothetical protein [Solirubrobacteraceae bacterium]